MTKRAILLALIGFVALGLSAQEEPEYRLEAGGSLAMVSYEGDFNGNLLYRPQPMLDAVVKYRKNPRMSWAFTVGVGKLKGSSEHADTWYPELADNPIAFSSTLTNIDVRYEYNFWAFGTGREYRGARRLTPFIAIGAGLSIAKTAGTAVGAQMPVGLGIKYKLKDRLNLTAEWTMHFTGTDKLDGISDPYGIQSSGLFKNTDCYSALRLSLTYDLWAKCKNCNNDRD